MRRDWTFYPPCPQIYGALAGAAGVLVLCRQLVMASIVIWLFAPICVCLFGCFVYLVSWLVCLVCLCLYFCCDICYANSRTGEVIPITMELWIISMCSARHFSTFKFNKFICRFCCHLKLQFYQMSFLRKQIRRMLQCSSIFQQLQLQLNNILSRHFISQQSSKFLRISRMFLDLISRQVIRSIFHNQQKQSILLQNAIKLIWQ